jgi:hypothetical protein
MNAACIFIFYIFSCILPSSFYLFSADVQVFPSTLASVPFCQPTGLWRQTYALSLSSEDFHSSRAEEVYYSHNQI